MRFWDEMQTKYGFGDGDAAPAGVDVYRRAYILAVNALAERLGSGVRAVAFNRAGMHNSCLIYMAFAEKANAFTPEQLASGEVPDLAPGDNYTGDEAMRDAIRAAYDLDVDSYVSCKVSFSKAAETSLLEAIKTAALEETE